jgi:carbon monoxide dehydrogenase subunit G
VKVTEAFVVQQPPQRLWEFFEQIDRVARCLPGVEDVEVIDSDNSRLRVTQALGPMSATFDLKMRITDREPGKAMRFTAIGRSVRGAAGNIRAANVVRLEGVERGEATRVLLDADVALGGMIGSVGQKVVAKQAGKVTKSFAATLERELAGGRPEPTPAAAPQPARAAASGAAPSPPAVGLLRTPVPVPLGVVLSVVFGAGYLAGRALQRASTCRSTRL